MPRSTTGNDLVGPVSCWFKKGVMIQWKLTTSEIFRSFTDLKPDFEETVLKSKPSAYDKATEFEIVSL